LELAARTIKKEIPMAKKKGKKKGGGKKKGKGKKGK